MLRAARAEARATCDVQKAQAGRIRGQAAKAKAEHVAELAHQRTMRRLERQQKERQLEKRPRLAKASTRRQESDDEVRENIPPELAFLWERVKRQIKGSERMTRTEAFLKYAEENPDEEIAAIEDKTDALIRELEQRERGGRRRARANQKKGKRQTGAQRELFMPASGQLEIVPSHEQKQLTRPKESAEARTIQLFKNPRQPPKAWWDRCIRALEGKGKRKVRNARAVCGATWWSLPPARRAAIVRRLERSNDPRQRGAALALAREEKKHQGGRRRPERRTNGRRELVSVVYEEQKPGDPEPFEYEHEFEGERPTLAMRGGALQVEGGSYRTRRGWIEG